MDQSHHTDLIFYLNTMLKRFLKIHDLLTLVLFRAVLIESSVIIFPFSDLLTAVIGFLSQLNWVELENPISLTHDEQNIQAYINLDSMAWE